MVKPSMASSLKATELSYLTFVQKKDCYKKFPPELKIENCAAY